MKPLYILLLIILPSAIFAQSNYHVGYVLKNNGDTLKGYINYGEWRQNPQSIELKVNKGDNKTLHFDPKTIKRFEIDGMETYISYTGMISMNRTNFNDVPETLDTSKKSDVVFLRQIVTGNRLTLYAYSDDIKTRFFIAETNGSPVELKYYEYYNGARQIVTRAIYKGQLMVYANEFYPGNEKISNHIDRASYEQFDMEPLIDEINNNGSPVKKISSTRFFAGIAINSTTTEVYNVTSTEQTQHSTTISPRINFGFEVFDNPNVQRFAFRVELSLFYVAPRYNYPVTVSGQNTNEVYEFNQYTAAITPQVLFNVYNKDDFKVYIDAGVAFNFSAYSNDQFTIKNAAADVTKANTTEQPYKLENFYSSFPLQVGITLNKKTEICLTYIAYAAYTKYDSFYASNRILSLGVKYLFGKP